MKKTIAQAALAAAILGGAATPVLAQAVIQRPLTLRVAPGVNPGPGAFRPVAGQRDAEHLANTVGMADVDGADLEDGVWVVTGTDVDDKDMTVKVDARTGRILQARYD